GGRLKAQRALCYKMLNDMDGITVNQAEGAVFLFPKIDTDKFNITSDEKFMLDLLREQKILLSHGTAFNWDKP
ncbi:aminotransferase, partial [Eggerthella lenta]|nr:aminotransferase [Eggerthella lenta]